MWILSFEHGLGTLQLSHETHLETKLSDFELELAYQP